MPALPPLVDAMLQPGFYPHHPETVDLVQTHISFVFLAGDEVYKVKKSVRFSFLDFSTDEQRRRFCAEELRLNRRLAPGVYLEVVGISRRGDGFALTAADDPAVVEHAVHMRRLPDERMLDRLLDAGRATPAMIEQVADVLVEFHRNAEDGSELAAGGDPAVIARLFEDDTREVAPFHGRTISAADDADIQRYCRRFLAGHDPLLRRRQAEGRIRDGHGDLHTEHICFTAHGVAIFDCIEFNPAFRQRDVAADLAFLAMDLEYHGRADLAARLVQRYAERSGDPELPRLVPFYACQRAYIRGKVDSLKSIEPEVPDRDRAAAADSARRHFALAYRYTWSEARLLVVVVGLSGSGKSTVAAALCERTGFVHINSDTTRKRLAGLPPTARPGPSLYTPAQSARTYAAMYAAAAESLVAGRGAIIDATFQRRVDRDAARRVAQDAGVPVLFVECTCPEAEVRRRLTEREQRSDDASDADWAIFLQQQRTAEPFAADEMPERLAIDTTLPLDELLASIESRLRALVRSEE
jgi:aminoglycoside phosphotransferase family enzyme/predicted kinase